MITIYLKKTKHKTLMEANVNVVVVVEVEATFKTDAVVLITKKQVLNVSMQG